MKPGTLKIHILGPLAIVLIILATLFIWESYHFYRKEILNNVRTQLSEIKEYIDDELEENTETLNLILSFLQKDTSIQQAWLNNDRETLLKRSHIIFEHFNSENRLEHFDFHDLNGDNLLAVYESDKYD